MNRYRPVLNRCYRVGQELEHLDRFIAVNRQAFRKILKKCRKWTGSSDVENRFHEHILSQPTSFTNKNLIPALAHYNELLVAARTASIFSVSAPPIRSTTVQAQENGVNTSSVAADIQYAYENGSDVELDTALAFLPHGPKGGSACYWVHNDNLLQIQVLLLRYMRSRKNQVCTSVQTPPSSRASPRGSIGGSGQIPIPWSNQKASVIVCDELEHFAERRSGAPLSESENEALKGLNKTAASIRYSSSGEAVLTIDTSSLETLKADHACPWRTTKLKRKALGSLFNNESREISKLSQDAKPMTNGVGSVKNSSDCIQSYLHSMPSLADARSWLREHQDVQPLVEIHSKRTRFAGIHNTDTSGLWASLDTDITLCKCSSALLAKECDAYPGEESSSSQVYFPHAVLNVRYEGDDDLDLIKRLDNSHLTERVRGFSLDTHAVAILYKPQRMPPPYWLPLLDQDIRKVPNEGESGQSASDGRTTPRSGSPRKTSISATSTNDFANGSGFSTRLESSETSVPESSEPQLEASRKKKKLRRESLRRKIQDPSQPGNMRYWNEYEDSDEITGDNAYTILVDSNASSTFPGAAALSRFTEASSKRIKSFFHHERASDLERQPLLSDRPSPTQSSSEDSSLEDGTSPNSYRTAHSHLGLLYDPRAKRLALPDKKDTWLTVLCVMCFVISFVLLSMNVILVNTSRRKAVAESDVGFFLGLAFSLSLGIAGLGMLAARDKGVDWVWWVVMALLFVALVVGNSVLVSIVL